LTGIRQVEELKAMTKMRKYKQELKDFLFCQPHLMILLALLKTALCIKANTRTPSDFLIAIPLRWSE
jgi:hypothetical protein